MNLNFFIELLQFEFFFRCELLVLISLWLIVILLEIIFIKVRVGALESFERSLRVLLQGKSA